MITISTGSTVSMKSFNVGSSGGVGCELIVNGTLTAETDDTAIITGKLKIGSSGGLNVGCETGAIIKGMTNENFVPLFIFNDGAKFTGNAEDCNIMVGPVSPTKEANDLFSLSANCIPDGYIIKKIVYNEYNTYFTITQDSQTPIKLISAHI